MKRSQKVIESTDINNKVSDNNSENQAPICHFTEMEYGWSNNSNYGLIEFWKCKYCGHSIELRAPANELWYWC